MIYNELTERHGMQWKIREALNYEEAANAINHAMVSGSVGYKFVRLDDKRELILADVVRVDENGDEVKPA